MLGDFWGHPGHKRQPWTASSEIQVPRVHLTRGPPVGTQVKSPGWARLPSKPDMEGTVLMASEQPSALSTRSLLQGTEDSPPLPQPSPAHFQATKLWNMMDGCCLKPLSMGSVCYTTEHNCNTRHSKGGSVVRGNTHMIYFKGGLYFSGFRILGTAHNQKLSTQIRQTSPTYSGFPPPITPGIYMLFCFILMLLKGWQRPHTAFMSHSLEGTAPYNLHSSTVAVI